MLHCCRKRIPKSTLQKGGYKVPADDNGNGAETHHIKTKAPKEEYTAYFNERKGIATRVPKGVHPAFAWNQGKPRAEQVKQVLANTYFERTIRGLLHETCGFDFQEQFGHIAFLCLTGAWNMKETHLRSCFLFLKQ